MHHLLFPSQQTDYETMDSKATFAKLKSASTKLQTTEEFISFARQSIAQLCCFNALLWEALIGLVVGRARLKHFLCFEYFRRKTELFQELYFTRDRNRCSSLSNKPTSKAGIYRAIAAAVRSMNFVSMIPPLEVFCREVDECPKRPLIIFEENYCRFGRACELCGTRQEGGCVSERHTASSTWGKEASAHCSPADPPRKTFTPMLFADSGSEDGFVPPSRCKPAEKDAAAWKNSEKARAKLHLCGNISWIMSEPWFLRHADNCFVLRQLYKGRETVDHYCSTTGANIHFIVFVHGLGGRSCDFYWAKRWMKLLITTPKHLLIWSEANGGDKTFDEIGLCGERLAQEVANYLNNIGATNFKLSFVGFSLGCVTIRAALTCPQMRPYIKNLNTFLSLHGPHLGVLYANNKFLRFQLSLLSKMKMKGSMKQLAFQDSPDIRTSYIYILSRAPGFEYFKHVLLMGSSQDRIVPVHSSNVQHCTESLADNTVTGKAYEEMIENLLGPLLKREDVTLKRFDVFHDIGSLKYLSPVILSLSHVSTLMSRNLFEKFMLISGADCFN
ncbi:protein FAM135B-like [Ixodes scapularis]